MVFVLAPATIVLMMMVLVAVAVQETARRRRKQQKQQYFQQASPTTKSSDDLEIGTLTPPPGPTPIPFFGNLLSLRKYSECPYQGFCELKEKYGPVYSLKMGNNPTVVVNTFDTIKEVLINKANSFDARPDLLRFKLYFGGDRQHCEYLHAASVTSLFRPDFLSMPQRTTFLFPLAQVPSTSQTRISADSLFVF
uniref:Cytochrome P450 n=1 Tax=Scylla olivacea TaxID=85551 RepID=A0A0P4VXB1_SCYOL